MLFGLHFRYAIVCALGLILVAAFSGCSGQTVTQPVQAPPEPVNNPPAITDLHADTMIVQPPGTSNIICTATDPDGDHLTYRWTTSGGTVDGSGASATWTAPVSPGSYLITVVVSDGKDGATSRDITLTVPEKPNNPPIITAIKFTPDNKSTIIIKPNPTDLEKKKYPPVVVKWTPAVIECVASDSDDDNIKYIWKTTGGKITGTGPIINWLGVGDPGSYSVTCEISDDKGGTDSLTFNVTVKCCGG
jgi:hypothetical protein